MEAQLRSLPATQATSHLIETSQPTTKFFFRISRIQVVRALEAVQDLIVISLCLGLFCVMEF